MLAVEMGLLSLLCHDWCDYETVWILVAVPHP